jgi:L-ascorbate metabolism protein UlaG (beta-lactamase superfamily)
MPRSLFAAGLAAAALVSAGGCDSQPAFGGVRGTVTYDGRPLPAGQVVFTNEAATFMGSAYLKGDGTYEARNVPAGAVLVAVKTDEFRDQIDDRTLRALQKKGVPIVAPDPAVKGTKYIPIPARYGDPASSGLRFEVKKDDVTTIDIDLKR